MMNGETSQIEIPVNPNVAACVTLLKQVLASAEAGQITSVCIVACGPGGFGASFAGTDAPSLNLGLDSAKAEILARVTQPAKRSSIIPARFGR